MTSAMQSDKYTVETPEVVTIEYVVAGVASRCLAATVDTTLILLLQATLSLVMVPLASSNDFGTIILALWATLAFALLWGYYVSFEMLWSGQSPGKRIFGLRVMREGGRPLDFSAAVIRNLVRIVDFLPFGYGLGVMVMFADHRARRLGDLAAGTLVIREDYPLSLEQIARGLAPVVVPPRNSAAPASPLLPNLHQVGPDDYTLAEAFLQRRETLHQDERRLLATELANALRMRLDLPSDGDPERFVEHFVREYRIFYLVRQA
ncbi:RDD family protein [Candidatus Chloroploca sp. Khr17]|uniref:RDD family protein n=1 Tax=Candidatus Chloroploca sp. Khr17 TaxID=2496869 RepID=UPI00101D9C43|nr:RDD family protein [Candidatus Chloroploca sp. Khr17]